MREPVPPIEVVVADGSTPTSRLDLGRVEVPAPVRAELASVCETNDDSVVTAEHGRDWWPLAMKWALAGQVPERAAVVCRPRSTAEVSAVAAICHRHHLPLTVTAGRSGVCGASIPVHGGVVLDTTNLRGVVAIDTVSHVVEVRPGTFGPELEDDLARHGLTVGHFPQSFDISTVGGWVACRGAGQYSTRYGKIEDMVAGLEVVLADGRVVLTGGAPRAAVGPDLNQLFVGSEGTLGIVTRIWLRAHPKPSFERRAAYGFADFGAGLDACRRIVQRGATPAVLRLYDAEESARGRGGDGTDCVLLVLDEGDPATVDASMNVVDEECLATDGCFPRDSRLVDEWMQHRNDTSALQTLTRKGFVVDTMEVTGRWADLPRIFDDARRALLGVPATRAATCHLSHSYTDGACLYFSFAARPDDDSFEATYENLWNAGTRAVLAAGGNLSHHHGVGLNRARFVAEALGDALDVLASIKTALDPHGILNPGKMGLPDRYAR